jgi:hypothetical protein
MRTPFILEPFVRSFYSGTFYYQVFKRWEWKTLGYAFLFAALLPLMTAGKFYFFAQDLSAMLPSDLPVIQKYIESVSFKDVRVQVVPVKDTNIVKEGVYTIPDKDGKPLAVITTIGYTVPGYKDEAKYFLSSREAAIRVNGQIVKMNNLPEFSFKPTDGISSLTSTSISMYIAKMYPLWARNRIMLFMAYAFLFVIPIWGVSRYFGMRLPFYKLLSMSIITLTPAVITDTVLLVLFNNNVLDIVYISLMTIGYQVFAFYRITRIEQDEIDAAEKAAENKKTGGSN